MRGALPTFLFVAMPLALSIAATAAARSSETPPREADFLLKGMQDARQRLLTGVFRASGWWSDERLEDRRRSDGEIEVYCAFDFAERVLRFDRSQVYPADAAGPGKPQPRASKYVRTPKESLFFWDDSSIIEVQPADWQHGAYGIPFDVRLVGLSTWAEFLFGQRFEDSYAGLLAETLVGVSEEPTGIRHITWLCDGDARDVKRELWLNEQEGFTPVHAEVRYLDKRTNQWGEPVSIGDASWQEKSGIWVPRTWTIEDRQGRGNLTRYDLSFHWESVNEPVAPELFTAEGMKPRKGTLVVTSELGKPIVRETVGFPTFEHPQSVRQDGASAVLRWKIIGVMGGILLFGALWLLVRQHRYATRGPSEP